MLFSRKKKTTNDKIVNKRTNYAGESLEHLDKDGNLPWGWLSANREFCDKIQNEYSYFLNLWIESKNQEPKKRYEGLKSLVLWLNSAKTLCYSMNECFSKWFSDVIASDEDIARWETDLDELQNNFHEIERVWNIRQRELPKLEENIKFYIQQHDGILQTDFVKMFDEVIHHEVKEKLYYMAKAGTIERIKSGRSYALHINKGQE